MSGRAGSVAVLIPALDASATIARAIRSALAEPQTAEVVVIDDGSRDNTAEVALRAGGGSEKVRLLQQMNTGPSTALNRGHDESRSEFVCVLDADDFFVPGRFARLFAAPEDWEFIADRLLLAREGAEDGPYELWAGRLPPSGQLSLSAFVSGNITDPKRPRTELGYLQPLYRRAFVDQHKLSYNPAARLGEDYLFYAEALARGARFCVLEAPGYVAVSRAASLSHHHRAADLKALLDADEALGRTPGLSPAEREVLQRHAAATRRRWIYHLALDAKAAGRLAEALPTLLINARSLPYALSQAVSARLEKLMRRGAARDAVRRERRPASGA